MSLSEDLISHAAVLLNRLIPDGDDDVVKRRVVSASYYALFHRISGDAAHLIAPNVEPRTNHRIQRWFDHIEMKRICGRFLKETLDQPLRGMIGEASSADLQIVCRNFIQIQEARHEADYDLDYSLSRKQAVEYLSLAVDAIRAWQRIKDSAEANIFILSLLLWKNWEDKGRR